MDYFIPMLLCVFHLAYKIVLPTEKIISMTRPYVFEPETPCDSQTYGDCLQIIATWLKSVNIFTTTRRKRTMTTTNKDF